MKNSEEKTIMNLNIVLDVQSEQDCGNHQQYHPCPRNGPSCARRREKRAADRKQAAEKANAEVAQKKMRLSS